MRIDAHPMRIGRCIRMANPNLNPCFKFNQSDVKDGLYSAPVHVLCHKGEAFRPDGNDNDPDGWR